MADTKMGVKTTHIVIGVGALIIILLVGWMISTRMRVSSTVVGENDKTNASEKTPVTTTTNTQTGGALVVEDQVAGERVVIKAMEMSSTGWIAIKEVASGRILGAGWFPAGATSGSVPLLRATSAGQNYEAVVYVDDGNKVFDMKVDTLVAGVSAPFKAQ